MKVFIGRMPTKVRLLSPRIRQWQFELLNIIFMVYQYPLHADYVVMHALECVDHLLSGCMFIIATMYRQRYDSFAKIIHLSLSRQFNFIVPTKY